MASRDLKKRQGPSVDTNTVVLVVAGVAGLYILSKPIDTVADTVADTTEWGRDLISGVVHNTGRAMCRTPLLGRVLCSRAQRRRAR